MFFKIGVVSVSLFLIKLHAYEPATLLKRNSNAVFSNEYCEIFQVAPLVAVSAEWNMIMEIKRLPSCKIHSL